MNKEYNPMKMLIIAGARPNFMKIAPIIDSIRRREPSQESKIGFQLVHTGQHYDKKMSTLFFNDLGIPKPDINLDVGSASHAIQTAEIMRRFEDVCLKEKPGYVLVVGDVNSTIACALVASKLGIKVIHVEAGLRSFDRAMPEEINRVLTDAISDILFTTEKCANENLQREGIPEEKIHFVGNVMIDTLLKHKEKAEKSDILTRLGLALNLTNTNIDNSVNPYAVLTLHRPSNVDSEEIFKSILEALSVIGRRMPIVFPIHPRTLNRISEFGFDKFFDWKLFYRSATINLANPLTLIPPQGYLDFLSLMTHAKLVLTDSGGIQEETTILGISCVTLRENTERPATVTYGTNVIAGTKRDNIIKAAVSQLDHLSELNESNISPGTSIPPLWDGKASERIVDILFNL